jgi:hypothetical protein
MRTTDFLNEMPVASFNAVGDLGTGPDGKQFTMADWKVSHSEKALAKIYRIFEKTPYWFNFVVVFSKNESLGRLMFDNKTGAEALSKVVGHPVKTEGAITVVYNNHVTASSNRMPLSAWTLAHRFGHAAHLNNSQSESDYPVAKLWNKIDYDLRVILEDAYRRIAIGPTEGKNTGRRHETAMASIFCTFKSARDNNMNSNWEVVADLIAQYLISGRIRLYRLDQVVQKLNVDLTELSDRNYDLINTRVAQAEEELNACMKTILDAMVGTIVGF